MDKKQSNQNRNLQRHDSKEEVKKKQERQSTARCIHTLVQVLAFDQDHQNELVQFVAFDLVMIKIGRMKCSISNE